MEKINIDLLLYWARRMGIGVVFTELEPGRLGQANAAKRKIELSHSLSDNLIALKCVLAHEIGHILFPPRPGHIRYHSKGPRNRDYGIIKTTVAQDERKAQDWAITVLMSDVEFDRIMKKGEMSISEIAEYFEVLPSFVEDRIAYYRRKEESAGRKVRWRDVIRRG